MQEDNSDHDAQKMAKMVETWLGNPVSRKILRFCTKRCTCGRRIELVLKDYAGEKQQLCRGCRISRYLVGKVLNKFIASSGIAKSEILTNLKDPMWRKGLSSVLEGIAKFGAQKPFTSSSPFLIVWNVTRRCNLMCKHCYENAHVPSADELTPEEALKTVDAMADAGVAYIAISGGEPLSRPDFFDIARRIQEREMAFSIATNGTLLTEENVEKLKKVNCIFVQVSLDGARPETHDFLRGKGIFQKTIAGITNAVNGGMTVGVAMTVTQHNLKEVPEAVALAEELGVKIFMHYNFIPTGRGTEIMNLDISPKEREELLNYLSSQIGKRKNLSILSTAPQYARVCAANKCAGMSMTHFDTITQEFDASSVKFLADFVGGCGTGRLYCAMEPNGDIEPCVFIPIICGNIKKDNLLEIWEKNPSLLALRDRKNFKGRCQKCRHRNICGGCRARAYGYFKDLQQSDPGCIFNEDEWNKLKAN